MNQQSSTVEQLVEALATLEVRCPSCEGVGGTPLGLEYCPVCRGPGQVAKYPMLRGPCQFCSNPANYTWDMDRIDWKVIRVPHPDCQGRGWMPVTTVEALFEAVWTIAHHVEIDRETGREGGPIDIWLTLEGQTGDEDDLPWGEGKTVAEALAQALAAAEGLEVK